MRNIFLKFQSTEFKPKGDFFKIMNSLHSYSRFTLVSFILSIEWIPTFDARNYYFNKKMLYENRHSLNVYENRCFPFRQNLPQILVS